MERIEHFNSLEEGEFWRSTSFTLKDYVDLGDIVLINEVHLVDGVPHTIVLSAPPYAPKPNSKFKLLVQDFNESFEYIDPEFAEASRQKNLADLNARVAFIQSDIAEKSANPLLIDQAISQLQSNASGTGVIVSGELVLDARYIDHIEDTAIISGDSKGLSESKIEGLRSQLSNSSKIVEKRSEWLINRTSDITNVIQAMTPFYEEKSLISLAKSKRYVDGIKKIDDGIKSLYLYILKDVSVQTIASGQSAPKEIPLSVTQRKLVMLDELLGVRGDVPKFFDSKIGDNIFFEELANNQKLIDQIFPTERCIVTICTNENELHYDKFYTSYINNKKNQQTILLVRNGENIHVVYSPDQYHCQLPMLFPSKDMANKIFKGTDGSEITYKSIGYTDSLTKHERLEVNFKRLLILICGLDHGKNLFGEFYHGEKSMDFMSMAFQEKHMNFIHDYDGEGLLDNPEKRLFPDLSEFFAQANRNICNNSLVIIDTQDNFSNRTVPSAFSRNASTNFQEQQEHSPVSEYDLCTVKAGKKLYTDIETHVNLTTFKPNHFEECKTYQRKLNLSYALSSMSQDPSILCLDAVSIEDIDRLLSDRDARKCHKAMRLLHQAKYQLETNSNSVFVEDLACHSYKAPFENELYRCAVNEAKAFSKLNGLDQVSSELVSKIFMSKIDRDGFMSLVRSKTEDPCSISHATLNLKGDLIIYVTHKMEDDLGESDLFRIINVDQESISFGQAYSFPKDEWFVLTLNKTESNIEKQKRTFRSIKARQKFLARADSSPSIISTLSSKSSKGLVHMIPYLLSLHEGIQYRLHAGSKVFVEPLMTIPVGILVYEERPRDLVLSTNFYQFLISLSLKSDGAYMADIRDSYVSNLRDKDHAFKVFNAHILNLRELLDKNEDLVVMNGFDFIKTYFAKRSVPYAQSYRDLSEVEEWELSGIVSNRMIRGFQVDHHKYKRESISKFIDEVVEDLNSHGIRTIKNKHGL